MSNDGEPYARVYHAKLQREYPQVWRDDALLSTWLRLHCVADASWPMHPPLPASIDPKALARLRRIGLVIVADDTYTTRGLDAERSARQDAARNAAATRWAKREQSTGNAGAYAGAMPTRTDPNRAEPNSDSPPPPAKRGRRKDGTNPRSQGTAPRQNGHAPRDLGASPRQERQAEKRGGLESLSAIVNAAALSRDDDGLIQ